jgi:ankyrin repeat protein
MTVGTIMPSARRRGRFGAVFAVLFLAAARAADAPVADAAMRGDREAVRQLIDQGADVNAAQGDGMTGLHWAAANGDLELTRLLLGAQARLETVTRIGAYAPLHLASRGGHAAVVDALLRAGADANRATTTGGVAALHLAATSGSAETVHALIAGGSRVDARDEAWGRTPLMFAAAANRITTLRALLERGADHRVATYVVRVPALAAADQAGRKARDAALAAFRAEAGDPRGWRPTPAQVDAAMRAAHEVQRASERPRDAALLGPETAEAQGYPAQVGTQGGMTALLMAAREGHAEAVDVLLAAGADIDQPNVGDGTTPLLIATINGHFDLASSLLARGANPNLAGEAGATPLYVALNLHWAPRSRFPQPRAQDQQKVTYLELMEALLEAGADPNARLTKQLWYVSYTYNDLDIDFTGATPFWRAAYGTDVEAMRLLVRYGADPHLPTTKPPETGRGPARAAGPDPSGLPPVPTGGPSVWPIHAATGVSYGEGFVANAHRHVPDGWLPALRYLVEEHGADVNARDVNGYTPLHHAAARGDNEMILYLVGKGADVRAVSRRGQTTVDMANGPNQRISPFPATIALLERLGGKNNHRCVSC